MSGVFGGVIAAVAAAAAAREAQTKAQYASVDVWRIAAAGFGMRFETRDARGTPAPRLEGFIGGVPCVFEIALDIEGWAYTRALADAPTPLDGVVAVHPDPHGVFASIKSALFGSEDVAVGDPAFDEAFLVHATPREAATLLDEGLRGALKAWLAHLFVAFTYERGRIALVWRGVELEPRVLGSAAAVVTHAATWRLDGAGGGYRQGG
jgi:hypothetical protein